MQAMIALVGPGDALHASLRQRLDLMRHASVALESMAEFAMALRAGRRFDLVVLVQPFGVTGDDLAMPCDSTTVPMLVVAEPQACIEMLGRRVSIAHGVYFVTLPESRGEFESSVRRMLTRFGTGVSMPPATDEVVCSGFRFRVPQRAVVLPDGRTVRLKPREFQLALLLFCNLGRVLCRDWLWSRLWYRTPHVGDRSLDVCASGVRRALGLRQAGNGLVLHAIYGRGYQLDAVTAD